MPLTHSAQRRNGLVFPPGGGSGSQPRAAARARSTAHVFPVLSVLVIFSSEALTNTPYRDTGQRRPGGLGAFSVTGARARGEFLAGMRPPLRSCWNG